MNRWLGKLVTLTAAATLCAGAAFAGTGNLVMVQHAPALLQQAAPAGKHAVDSPLRVTFHLTGNGYAGAPTAAEIDAVEGYLQSFGIRVTAISSGRTVLRTRGTTGSYDHALRIEIQDYSYQGHKFFSSPGPLRLPAAVGQYVEGVFATHVVRGSRNGAAWESGLVLTPRGFAALVPSGTLSGMVTSAVTGAPVAGAKVAFTPGSWSVETGVHGRYSAVLPAGDYTMTVKAFPRHSKTASVTATAGNTVEHDVALPDATEATLSGMVTDGSGHGYPLYARVAVSTGGEQVAAVWTDPASGTYSVSLATGNTYTVDVTAYFEGYSVGTKTVTVSGDTTQDFALPVAAACAAPGYQFGGLGGFGEDFNASTFPPSGWTVTNPVSGNVVWGLSNDDDSSGGNWTGGTGTAAEANSNVTNISGDPYDTRLISPPIPVTSLDGTILRYKANFQVFSGTEAFDVDISTDGGVTWTTVQHITTEIGDLTSPPPNPTALVQQVDLAPQLPSSGSFQLRWRYYNLPGGWDWYAQVDDVVIGACEPVPGGVLTGQVVDAVTGEGIVGATVADAGGTSTTTFVNSADPSLPAGTYYFFDAPGQLSLTASKGNYVSTTKSLTLQDDGLVATDFSLSGPKFATDPDSITMHVMVNTSATSGFAISNTGNVAGAFTINGVSGPPPATAPSVVPVKHVQLAHPNWMARSIFWIRAHADPGEWRAAAPKGFLPVVASGPHDAPWVDLADVPVKVGDNVAAFSTETGQLYTVTGVNNSSDGFAESFVYDPDSDSWSPIAPIPTPREAPVGAFVNGKLYVTGGAGPGNNAELDVYDPGTDNWSTGAPIPAPTIFASGVALNGKLYVVGGLSTTTGTTTSTVYVYDAATDTWGTAADYPHPVALEACGAISGKIYCGGGISTAPVNDAFVYDPATDDWSPIADLPYSVAGAVYAAGGGKLILAGGFRTGATATNEVIAYTPTTDSWNSLANLNHPVARAGGACGFYTVGSILSISGQTFTFSNKAQRLPGFGCPAAGGGGGGGPGGSLLPWLTGAPVQGTLEAGATAHISLTFHGEGHEKFTTSQGYLKVLGGTGTAPIVALTVHWMPQPIDLTVKGSVRPTGTVQAGDSLTYSITVANKPDAKTTATRTRLTFHIPDSLNYLAAEGATCAPPVSTQGDAHVVISPMPASVVGPGTVVCELGTIAPDDGKLVKIAAHATQDTEAITSTFSVSAREGIDLNPEDNTLTLTTETNAGPQGPQGPPGPPGPQGPKGGDGALGFAGLGLLALLGLGVFALESRRRRRQRG